MKVNLTADQKRKVLQFWYDENGHEFCDWLEAPNSMSESAISRLWNQELCALGDKEFQERLSEVDFESLER